MREKKRKHPTQSRLFCLLKLAFWRHWKQETRCFSRSQPCQSQLTSPLQSKLRQMQCCAGEGIGTIPFTLGILDISFGCNCAGSALSQTTDTYFSYDLKDPWGRMSKGEHQDRASTPSPQPAAVYSAWISKGTKRIYGYIYIYLYYRMDFSSVKMLFPFSNPHKLL